MSQEQRQDPKPMRCREAYISKYVMLHKDLGMIMKGRLQDGKSKQIRALAMTDTRMLRRHVRKNHCRRKTESSPIVKTDLTALQLNNQKDYNFLKPRKSGEAMEGSCESYIGW